MKKFAQSIKTIPGKGALLVVSTDGDQVEIPFSWFKANGKDAPNFGDVEIIDDGQTIRLGKYEADADFAIEEHTG